MADYIKLNCEDIQKKVSKIINLWETFLENVKTPYLDTFQNKTTVIVTERKIEDLYETNMFALREIFERTHQREDYFDRYHEKLKMSDFKEIGLIAFWISKFKPFHLSSSIFNEAFSLRINEEFALFFIFNAIANYASEQNQEVDLTKINAELYNELLYTMQYRDLSKEAFGCIVELIYLAMVSNQI